MKRGISVAEAIAAVCTAAPKPREQACALDKAHGRVLAETVTASRDQPPFAASAMDGYGVAAREAGPLRVIGESIAGRGFAGEVRAGEAVRIFTGAPVPEGATAVIIQENIERAGDMITLSLDGLSSAKTFIRPAGGDFTKGAVLLNRGQRLDAWALSLAAAAGRAGVAVARRPRIAILSNGDELVQAGATPRPDQIFESASFAILALADGWGAKARFAGQAADSEAAILATLKGIKADLIVTIGGASVGDHDLIKPALGKLGLEIDFAGVNVRPGRPTWFGVLKDGRRILGLPGNPASAMVCAELFLKPFILAAQGAALPAPLHAVLTADTPADGPREAYLRATLSVDHDGVNRVTAFAEQDSSLIQIFARANALVRIPPAVEALKAGASVEVLPLKRL